MNSTLFNNTQNNSNNTDLSEFLREMMAQQAHYEEVYSMYTNGNTKTTPKSIVDTLPVRNITTEDLKK